jgi:twitching motility protein PilU
VFRYIAVDDPPLGNLGLPAMMLGDLIMEKRGPAADGGRHRRRQEHHAGLHDRLTATRPLSGHILTIEDPIEFLFKNKRSVINQREIGTDTKSLDTGGAQECLRQAPDVILIGEIRDRETMSAALAYAQSGHLCLATMHANNSYQALNRILSFYPVEVRQTMLGDLAAALKAIVSQRLLRNTAMARVFPPSRSCSTPS